MMSRGAATDLMEQVGDALATPRVASVAGERSPCWWIEKGVRTKNASQSGQGHETGRAKARFPIRTVPRATRVPRPPTVWGITLWSKKISMREDGETASKTLDK